MRPRASGSTAIVDQDRVQVDLSILGGPATRRAAGLDYGLTEDGTRPPDELVVPLGLRFLRAGGARLDDPGGWVVDRYERRLCSTLAQARRAASIGASFTLAVQDLWGADGPAPCRWPGDDDDWGAFDAFLDQLVVDVRAADVDVEWELWTVPDVAMASGRSRDQYFRLWERAYHAIRSRVPDAVTVGPCTPGAPIERDPWWAAFCEFANAHDVWPDVLSWHGIAGAAHMQDAVAGRHAAEGLIASSGRSVASFRFGGYAQPGQQRPGRSAWFISRLERAGVDGLRANWGQGPTLHDDLATLLAHDHDIYAPLGDWFTYVRYATQRGHIADSQPGRSTDVFATLEEPGEDGRPVARLLVGNRGETGGHVAVEVCDLARLGRSDRGRVMGTVRVTIERIRHDDGSPSAGPSTLLDAPVKARSASLVLVLDYDDPTDAYFITLRPPG